jgi:hypothetical protein
MARTAGEIIALAGQIAKTPGYTRQAATLLNGILGDFCETYDLAVARGLFQFNFNPGLTTDYGSGPYPLPLDYLRTSGSSGSEGTQHSVWWTLLGVPYPMIPCDLAEFDMQVQQAGLQSYPWLWATDMAQRVIMLSTVGDLTPSTVVPAWIWGQAIWGQSEWGAGSETPGLLTNLLSTDGIVVGMYVSGPGIPQLARVVSVTPAGSLPSAAGGFLPAAGGGSLPSAAGGSPIIGIMPGPTLAITGQPLLFGYPGEAYVYPPPSGAYPVTCRYQRDMPDLPWTADLTLTPAASGQVPWFPNFEILKLKLAADLMELADDSRAQSYRAEAIGMFSAYLKMKDDDTNRAKTIQFDRRTFGPNFRNLRNTKVEGW